MTIAKFITPVTEELNDASPPAVLFNNIRDHPHSFFLDSACGRGKLGRYSIIGCDPFLVFKSKADIIDLQWQDGRAERFRSNPFLALKDLLDRYRIPATAGEVPLIGGAVGYFAYDLKNFIEDLPDRSRDDMGIPDCILGFYDTVLVYDHIRQRAFFVSSGLPESEGAKAARRRTERLKEFKDRVFRNMPAPGAAVIKKPKPYIGSNFTKDSYIEAVEKAKAYIRRGDIYQVNLSQRFETRLDMTPFELYWRLRSCSPAPFSSYLGFGDIAVASSSPERFLLKKGHYIETRPIKGTRPRGLNGSDDLLLGQELILSAKDRAEHIMIVDLERNDLGRICKYGSVMPTESLALEKYANVFHLVSTVSGRLKHKIDPVDCLLASFPGGSITGAPKIRAMEIIDELEPVRRSVYTGAIGYISFNGDMDMSIVIRTFVIKGRTAYFQVGGGIVADSDPENEYEETLHKAKGLMEALGERPACDKKYESLVK